MFKKYSVIIPARGGSKRFPKKNIVLFKHTINFLKDNDDVFDVCYVSSDSDEILNMAEDSSAVALRRPDCLCQDNTPIKPVIQDVVARQNLYDQDIFMMYLTSPERHIDHYKEAIAKYTVLDLKSIMSCYRPDDSPYLAYYADTQEKVIEHNLYRYQDYRTICNITHYICLFNGGILHSLDNQLYDKRYTYLINVGKKPIDIDYSAQYTEWISQRS
jgi:CMP-N-acetylneuraminic acid synthetase